LVALELSFKAVNKESISTRIRVARPVSFIPIHCSTVANLSGSHRARSKVANKESIHRYLSTRIRVARLVVYSNSLFHRMIANGQLFGSHRDNFKAVYLGSC